LTSTLLHPTDLEPSHQGARTYATRRLRGRIEVTYVICAVVVLLYFLPATLIVPDLTFAGRPALLLSLVLFAWWVLARLNPRLLVVGPQPLRWIALAYMLSILLSYIAGVLRGLPTLESNAENFSLLVTAEFLGLILMAADGIPNWMRLRTVIRVFVVSAAFMAVVGLMQSLFKFDLRTYLILPGLTIHSGLADFAERGVGLVRVAGTAAHYIEFSAALAVAVPYGVHCTLFATSKRARIWYGIATLLITAAIPVSVSRSGVVALGASVGVMFVLAWNWRTRYNVMFIGLFVVGSLVIVKPGLIGTLRSLFDNAGTDPSITHRTNQYTLVAQWFSQRPLLGRGPGTLIPDLYLILDNQWLNSLVTTGIVGVAALALIHITGITLAAIARKRTTRAEDRHLCAALISTQIVAALASFTFDSLSFTTFSFTLALLTGICGVVWRFTHPTRVVRTSTVHKMSD
jgi:O-antigen ligase